MTNLDSVLKSREITLLTDRLPFNTVLISGPAVGAAVSKVMSLFFNMLSRLVIAFLPRSKDLLFSWLQSPLGRREKVLWEP